MKNGRVWRNMMFCMLLSAGLVLGRGSLFGALASDKEVETISLEEPERVWWEGTTVGRWSSVKNAHEYQVKLFLADHVTRDEENWQEFDYEDEDLETVMTVRTSERTFDFREYMEDGHIYFFAVRATPKISEQAYVEAGAWIASPNQDLQSAAVMGITGGTWRNYLEGSRYEEKNGNLLGSGWHRIQGDWYLFNEEGYRLTGWQKEENNWYYLDENGRMQTGWIWYEGAWYYANADGQMQTGCIMTQPGAYYNFDEDGRLISEAAK